MSPPAASPASPPLPADLAAAHAMILAERQARIEAQAEASRIKAAASSTEAMIAHLKLQIEKLRRELYGQRSERTARLLDQMELQLEELEAKATEDEIAAETAARQASLPAPAPRRRPSRKPFPEHLPRERVVVPAPTSCPCCGSMKLSKLGEDVTETLEVVPRSWKVIQTVREKFTCRQCEAITQPPAPFHVTPRGFVGPNLLATILFEKFGQHQPLNRQSERYAREGVDLSVSTLADQVGAATTALAPLHALIRAHARCGFFELADIAATARAAPKATPVSPIALEAVRRIDLLFAIEPAINGRSAEERRRIRQEQAKPLVDDLHAWLQEQRGKLSRSSSVAKPIDYMLKRWDRFAVFLDEGRVCLSNNAAERSLRGFALGRKAWLFAGSDRGADRAAAMATLIATAKLNDVDPQAWIADALARIAGLPQSRLAELLPWNWRVECAEQRHAA